MKSLFVLFLTLFFYGISTAQPQISWQKSFGGSFSDGISKIRQTSDGNLIMAGYTYSEGEGFSDIYIVKTDTAGIQLWSKTYGSKAFDYGYDITETSDGNYLVTGYSSSPINGNKDIILLKTDYNGNLIWSKTFGGPKNDIGISVFENIPGQYVLAGTTESFGAGESDVIVILTNSSGDSVYCNVVGGKKPEWIKSYVKTSDNGFVLAGATGSFGAFNKDVYIIKFSAAGEVIFQKNYNLATLDCAYDIKIGNNGNYIIAGSFDNDGKDCMNAFLMEVDTAGTLKWNTSYGISSFYDYGSALCFPYEDGYLIAGNTKYKQGYRNDILLMKTDLKGKLSWKKSFGTSNSDWGNSAIQLSNGSIIIAGYTYVDSSKLQSTNAYLIKLSSSATDVDDYQGNSQGYNMLQNYPNPFNNSTVLTFSLPKKTNINLTIYNTIGQKIQTLINEEYPEGIHKVNFNSEQLSSGIYLCRFSSPEFVSYKKILLVK